MVCKIKPKNFDLTKFLNKEIGFNSVGGMKLKALNKEYKKTQNELRLATSLQKSLMKDQKFFSKLDMYGRYLPITDLAGDMYDLVKVNDNYWFIISDVMGHGISASMISFMIKALFFQSIQYHKTPDKVLEDINKTFIEMMGTDNNIIFSAFIGLINENNLLYSNAGHPYPLLIDSTTNETKLIKNTDTILGIFKDIKYNLGQAKLKKDDLLILFTDGLYENSYLGDISKVYHYTKNYNIKDPDKYLDDLINHFKKYNNNFTDDVTTMLIKIK
ncbi:MAG: serine/threonine-protein phosphatase [Firmicutes bacterium]|nr:serine/threonine-protein phosphatase [Bacillota bacterium]